MDYKELLQHAGDCLHESQPPYKDPEVWKASRKTNEELGNHSEEILPHQYFYMTCSLDLCNAEGTQSLDRGDSSSEGQLKASLVPNFTTEDDCEKSECSASDTNCRGKISKNIPTNMANRSVDDADKETETYLSSSQTALNEDKIDLNTSSVIDDSKGERINYVEDSPLNTSESSISRDSANSLRLETSKEDLDEGAQYEDDNLSTTCESDESDGLLYVTGLDNLCSTPEKSFTSCDTDTCYSLKTNSSLNNDEASFKENSEGVAAFGEEKARQCCQSLNELHDCDSSEKEEDESSDKEEPETAYAFSLSELSREERRRVDLGVREPEERSAMSCHFSGSPDDQEVSCPEAVGEDTRFLVHNHAVLDPNAVVSPAYNNSYHGNAESGEMRKREEAVDNSCVSNNLNETEEPKICYRSRNEDSDFERSVETVGNEDVDSGSDAYPEDCPNCVAERRLSGHLECVCRTEVSIFIGRRSGRMSGRFSNSKNACNATEELLGDSDDMETCTSGKTKEREISEKTAGLLRRSRNNMELIYTESYQQRSENGQEQEPLSRRNGCRVLQTASQAEKPALGDRNAEDMSGDEEESRVQNPEQEFQATLENDKGENDSEVGELSCDENRKNCSLELQTFVKESSSVERLNTGRVEPSQEGQVSGDSKKGRVNCIESNSLASAQHQEECNDDRSTGKSKLENGIRDTYHTQENSFHKLSTFASDELTRYVESHQGNFDSNDDRGVDSKSVRLERNEKNSEDSRLSSLDFYERQVSRTTDKLSGISLEDRITPKIVASTSGSKPLTERHFEYKDSVPRASDLEKNRSISYLQVDSELDDVFFEQLPERSKPSNEGQEKITKLSDVDSLDGIRSLEETLETGTLSEQVFLFTNSKRKVISETKEKECEVGSCRPEGNKEEDHALSEGFSAVASQIRNGNLSAFRVNSPGTENLGWEEKLSLIGGQRDLEKSLTKNVSCNESESSEVDKSFTPSELHDRTETDSESGIVIIGYNNQRPDNLNDLKKENEELESSVSYLSSELRKKDTRIKFLEERNSELTKAFNIAELLRKRSITEDQIMTAGAIADPEVFCSKGKSDHKHHKSSEANKNDSTISNLRKSILEKEGMLITLRERVKMLEKDVEIFNSERKDLITALDVRTVAFIRTTEELDDLKSELVAIQQFWNIDSKGTADTIKQLNSKLMQKAAQLGEAAAKEKRTELKCKTEYKILENQFRSLRKTLSERDNQCRKLEDEVSHQRDIISELKEKISRGRNILASLRDDQMGKDSSGLSAVCGEETVVVSSSDDEESIADDPDYMPSDVLRSTKVTKSAKVGNVQSERKGRKNSARKARSLDQTGSAYHLRFRVSKSESVAEDKENRNQEGQTSNVRRRKLFKPERELLVCSPVEEEKSPLSPHSVVNRKLKLKKQGDYFF